MKSSGSFILVVASWALTGLPFSAALPPPAYGNISSSCRCIPGDGCWPGTQEWARLNSTVGGKLIATVPVASPCHEPNFDPAACSVLRAEWDRPATHIFHPSSIMAPYFQNRSCDPFTPASTACTLGNYVSYSINVTSASDAVAGVNFAEQKNVRLVVKNTGHDFLGKSTGQGALGLWTSNLKSIDIITDYNSKNYQGPAMKVGAGVLSVEAAVAAYKSGFRVVAGTCPTVSLAGGFTQGGGHSLLSSINGMSADNALEWEVVTAKGEYLVATPTQNSDLYWALSGGGGGTYGVVISLTTKIHPESQVGGASFSFNSSSVGLDAFWKAVDVFQARLGPIVDDGSTFLYQLTNTSLTAFSVTSPNRTKEQVTALLSPIMSALTDRQVPYSYDPTSFASYYEHFDNYYGPLPLGNFPVSQVTSSRLIPRAIVANNTAGVGRTFRSITANGNFYLGCTTLNAARPNGAVLPAGRNSVLPAWRSALLHCITVGPWDPSGPQSKLLALQAELTESVMPQLQAVASLNDGGGTYLNEANFEQQGWQREFYGAYYPRLRKVKRDHDPNDLFYAVTGVGSEAWAPDEEGRLCRA